MHICHSKRTKPFIKTNGKDAVQRGRSQDIKLPDGTKKKMSTWNNVNREWKLTALYRKEVLCKGGRPLHSAVACENPAYMHQKKHL